MKLKENNKFKIKYFENSCPVLIQLEFKYENLQKSKKDIKILKLPIM